MAEKTTELQNKIIRWYRKYGDRNLPWRNTKNPWEVLVAAFLLRKTTTSQVKKVYHRFIRKYPTPEKIYSAKITDLKNILRPLGIENQRAKLLKKLGCSIVQGFGGKIPNSRLLLKKLDGVGDYAASEVLLVAFDKPEPLLDRNMIRVICRFFGIKSSKPRPHTDLRLWNFARFLVPQKPKLAKEFNFGILDFARKICRPVPICQKCFLASSCSFFMKKHYKDPYRLFINDGRKRLKERNRNL